MALSKSTWKFAACIAEVNLRQELELTVTSAVEVLVLARPPLVNDSNSETDMLTMLSS